MRLPILVVSEFSFAVRLRIETSRTWPHESLWCKLVKCSRWNRLNAEDLLHVFGARIQSRRAMLDYPEPTLRRALLHHLALNEADLRQTFLPCALLRSIGLITLSLRGCPRCYRLGFHSPLFQVLTLVRCPLHGDDLVCGCPDCAAPQDFTLTANWRSDGPFCLSCGRKFLHAERKSTGPHATLVPIMPQLVRWRKTLVERFVDNCERPHYSVRFGNVTRVLSSALREWSQAYAVAMPRWSARAMPSRVLPPLEPSQICSEDELFATAARRYFQARRIWRRLLSPALARSVEYVMQVRNKPQGLPQPQEVIALVLWRIVWERLVTPPIATQLIRNDRVPLGVALWLASRPLALHFDSQPSLLDMFDRELIDCYARCRALATWMYRRGGTPPSLHALCILLSGPYLRWHQTQPRT